MGSVREVLRPHVEVYVTRILEDLSAQCDALENSIIGSFVRIDEAAHEALTALREYDDLAGWRRHGQRSCAQWFA